LLSSTRKFAATGRRATPRQRIVVAAIAISFLLPIEGSHAGWFSDLFKGSAKKNAAQPDKPAKRDDSPKQPAPARQAEPKQATLPKRAAAEKPAAAPKPAPEPKPATAPKPANVKLAALGPLNLSLAAALKPRCTPSKFRIIVDVGHTSESEGATSARNVSEYTYNLRLARRVEEKLKAEGFSETKLLITEGKARRSLVRRVDTANKLAADLFLSIHHDSVPDKFLEEWEFEGKKRYYSDRFSGHSVFVSRNNPEFAASLRFAELIGKEMKAQGLEYARQYSQAILGRYQKPLLNEETGVYAYDKLIVLKKTKMPAVLLESGSIINRDEELRMASATHREIVSSGVAIAIKQYCDIRWSLLGPL
jgi:N-acetylmuramoyl-L-alanine amidase